VSRAPNPTVIGGFVVGAVVLIVAALAVFGSGKFLAHRPRAVAFFQGNIQGLSVGSAVNLRGVQVGTVTDIQLRLNVDKMEPIIPVYMEFDPGRLRPSTEISQADRAQQKPLKDAIAHGLHARLAMQSLVTGQLVVELDLDPKEPRRFVGADPSTVEIPTSQSDVEKLKNTVSELPLQQISTAALKLLNDVDHLVNSEDLGALFRSLATASDSLNLLMTDARTDLKPLMGDVRETVGNSRDTLASAKSAMEELRTTLKTTDQLLGGDVRETVKGALATLQRAQQVLAAADGMVAVNSPQRYDVDQALRNLTATTRSLRIFAEDLERRPNSLVMGK
jgi:paraquat-inducible protein B